MNLNIHRPNKLLSLHLRHNHGHTYDKKNKNLRSKKRFTRENKISKVKRDSQPFFLKMPYYKNKFIVKTIHIRMFLYHLFKTLSINFPEFCELAEIESGSVSRFFLVPQYCWSSNQLQLW